MRPFPNLLAIIAHLDRASVCLYMARKAAASHAALSSCGCAIVIRFQNGARVIARAKRFAALESIWELHLALAHLRVA